MGNAHSLAICSRLSGISPRNHTIYVAGYCNFVIIEFVHCQQKVDFADFSLSLLRLFTPIVSPNTVF